jgi:hypothetical protein
MPLTRGEWVTLFVFLLALALNGALLNEEIQRNLGLCGDGVDYGGRPQTRCEEDPPTENKYLEPPQK